jgi:hypothetical protein
MDYFQKIKNWGLFLLAVWLILWGALSLLSISFPGLAVVMEVLAIAAGILLLLKK